MSYTEGSSKDIHNVFSLISCVLTWILEFSMFEEYVAFKIEIF